MEVPVEHLAELAERIKKLEEMEQRVRHLREVLKGNIPKGREKILIVNKEIRDFLKNYGLVEREHLVVNDLRKLPPFRLIKRAIFSVKEKNKVVYHTTDEKEFKKQVRAYKEAIRNALSRIPEEKKNLLKEYYYSILHAFELFNANFDEEVAKKLVELNAHQILGRVYPEGVLKVRRGEIKGPKELLELFYTRLHP